jgi:hypothetical protein
MMIDDYLNEMTDLKRTIESLKECIEKIESVIYQVSSITLSDLPRTTTQKDILDKLGDIQEKKQELARLQEEYQVMQNQLISFLVKLNNAEQVEIIKLRHLDNLKWENIRQKMKISESKSYKLYRLAKKELDKIIKNTVEIQ